MSDQNGKQASTKRRSSRPANKKKSSGSALPRPFNDDIREWRAYWKAQGQSWRLEPEIDAKRQLYLKGLRDVDKEYYVLGYHPFIGVKLSRADVEWLLATHENERGPIDWSDISQRKRNGLDLVGADLKEVNLLFLPLAMMDGGLITWDGKPADDKIEAIHLEGANLIKAHLEDASLGCANLEKVNFSGAHMEGAFLSGANLEAALFNRAHLEGADFSFAHLEGVNLVNAYLQGANLHSAFLDRLTYLDDAKVSNKKYGGVSLVDLRWGDANIAVIDWSMLNILGEERLARKPTSSYHRTRGDMLDEYRIAMRAYHQLAVILRNQGLNDDAARFTYRAQLMQRKVFWYQPKISRYFGSLFLDLLTGYGYKPMRSFLAYLIVILAFATTYFIIGRTVGPALSPLGSVVFSMTSFHGRGFFPGGITLDDPLTVLAALEAFVGLLIEVTFIATLTRRLFGG